MEQRLGIIGVGHLAAHLVEGLFRGGQRPQVLLSPRGRERVSHLARRFPVEVARDNRAVVDGSDVVILSVPPGAVQGAAHGLPFRADQLVISVAAAVPHAVVARAVHPARAVRSMPITAATIGESAMPVFPPDKRAERALAPIGPVHHLHEEAHFEACATVAMHYAWVFALMDANVRWLERQGVDPAVATSLVAQVTHASAAMVNAGSDDAAALDAAIARPGSFTRIGRDVLAARGVFDAWQEALDTALAATRKQAS